MSRRRPQRRLGAFSFSQHMSYEPRCQHFRSKSLLDHSAGFHRATIDPGRNWLSWAGVVLVLVFAGLMALASVTLWFNWMFSPL